MRSTKSCRAAKAQAEGKFEDEIIPIEVNKVDYDENGPVVSAVFKDDELIRPDTNQEALSKLPTVLRRTAQ